MTHGDCPMSLTCLPSRLHLFAILLGLFLAPGLCPAPPRRAEDAPERFVAQWRDGTISKARELVGWSGSGREYGRIVAMKITGATIGRRRLFDPRDPVRIVRNTSVQPSLASPFVELANGDVLPGTVISAGRASRAGKPPQVLSVGVLHPLTARTEGRVVRVRAGSVARVVFTKPTARRFSPGLVIRRDGREVMAKGIKWTPKGVQLLVEHSAQVVPWEELAEVHVPRPGRLGTILRDSLAAPTSGTNLLGRMKTKSGAEFTHLPERVRMDRMAGIQYHVVQPAWAEDGILIPVDNIASVYYRDVDEVPLSLLEAHTLSQRNLTGFTWHWRRNSTVRGQPLSVGGREAEVGVGTHAHSEIAFELPPNSISFSAQVGIDTAMGRGGCVRCSVFRDRVEGKPAWTGKLMRGGDEPVAVKVKDLAKTRRLVLVTEFADADHPADADPLDIGDAVSWLWATVRVGLPKRLADGGKLTDLLPALRGWSLSESMRKRISVRPRYLPAQARWGHAMVLDAGKFTRSAKPLVMTQDVDVSLANAWLLASFARDGQGAGFQVTVHADGKKVPGTEGYDGGTSGRGQGEFDTVAYSLGSYVGRKVSVTVRATPGRDQGETLSGLFWGELSFSPLIQGLPAGGRPIKPDVAIEAVKSLETLRKKAPLRLRFCQMTSGLTMPPGADSVSVPLDPQWNRFVACIGPQGLSTGTIGSFQVWIDKELIWESGRFARLTRSQQVDIRLPDETAGKRLKLQVVNESRVHAVWANAGFMLE